MTTKTEATIARKRGRSRSIHFTITPQMDDDMARMLATGYFGFSRTDVARRLLARAIMLELPALNAIERKRRKSR